MYNLNIMTFFENTYFFQRYVLFKVIYSLSITEEKQTFNIYAIFNNFT